MSLWCENAVKSIRVLSPSARATKAVLTERSAWLVFTFAERNALRRSRDIIARAVRAPGSRARVATTRAARAGVVATRGLHLRVGGGVGGAGVLEDGFSAFSTRSSTSPLCSVWPGLVTYCTTSKKYARSPSFQATRTTTLR